MDKRQLDLALEMAASSHKDDTPASAPPQGKVKRFFRKYFLEGQALEEDQLDALANYDPNAPFHERMLIKHRRAIGFLIPITFYHAIWWTLAIKHNFFANFVTHYPMTLTMIVGSAIGGATSEGGGAVAFPVMTLVLKLPPSVARDFSMMIQSCGMVCASFCILFMKIKLEWHSIIFCSTGALFGLIFGLEVVDHHLNSAEKKLIFVSVWFSFCVALFILNRQHKRKTYDTIPFFTPWKAILLVIVGFIGGNFTALAGSGTDICSFSVLCLLFRVSEKIATPTSVILMAINTLTGFFWRQFMTSTGAEPEAWKYLSVAVPTSVIAGPLGALLASHCHRQVLAWFVYILDTVALITALVVIHMTWQYWVMVVSLIIGGGFLFFVMAHLGEKMLQKNDEREKEEMRQRMATAQLQGFTNLSINLNDESPSEMSRVERRDSIITRRKSNVP